ncbi:MAG: hypothetical protein CL916_06350 [Deltaproteobacteria bacterium]|nr:hypothetical protein [Deltaproteobacteria bacterium]
MKSQDSLDQSSLSLYLDSRSGLPKGEASGKVMLFGEYAVLEGASAILTATPHRAKAHYLPLDYLNHIERIDAELGALLEQSDLHQDQLKYVIIAFQWGRALMLENKLGDLKHFGQDFELVKLCLKEASAPNGIYFIDTQSFGLSIDGKWQKMGIGSSGASSSALCNLLAQLPEVTLQEDLSNPYNRFLFAQQQHRAVQGGLGSGADVACSTFGGLIEFKLNNNSNPTVQRLPSPLPRTWGLWKGGSFSTSHSLSQLKQWQIQNLTQYQMHIANLTQASQRALDLFEVADSNSIKQDDWCGVIDYAAEAMRNFSRTVSLPLWTDTHSKWSKLVQKNGGVIKSTGAGGDDLTLFAAQSLSDEIRCLKLLERECTLQGEPFHIFPLSSLILDEEVLAIQKP